MRIPLSWLKEYVRIDVPPEELSERLTMVGLEVESLEYPGKGLEKIVVAQILGIRPHPNASKLVLCDVSDGTRAFNIVCGAKNMKTGDKVALAPPDAKLPPSDKFPEGLVIQAAKIRGEFSQGMLCAENELGIGEEGEGIIILPETAKVGDRLIDSLGLNDAVLEIAVTPNRPDCLSVIGIAREVSVILGAEIKRRDYEVPEDGEHIDKLASVEVHDSEGCPRYSCRVITNVKIAPSPDWLKNRLESSGIRSINNLVDVTNYVLLESGQPLHAFDYDLIEGRRIIVRPAKEGEVIKTLDGIERHLSKQDLLICDAFKPVAIAGVMGGWNTEVSENTAAILLESAYFDPVRVRRTSKRTNLRSESSYRFERGVDPNGIIKALDRASLLIREVADGNVSRGKIDVYPGPIAPNEVSVSLRQVKAILGVDIEHKKIEQIMEGLGLETMKAKADSISFKVPTFRVDLMREIDLIEELARHYGYNLFPTTLPQIVMKADGLKIEKNLENRVKEILISRGFLEAINYSFDDAPHLRFFDGIEPLKIMNPISNEGSAMRTNLAAGLIKNISLNLNRQTHDVRLFEIGNVYIPRDNGLPREIKEVAAAATGRRQPELWDKSEVDFFDLKGILENLLDLFSVREKVEFTDSQESPRAGLSASPVEGAAETHFLHPGKSTRVIIGEEEVGYLGELHPVVGEKLGISKRVYIFELDLARLTANTIQNNRRFIPLPKFPAVRRDIALVVKEDVPVGRILEELRKVEPGLIEEISVFDVFKGNTVEEGKKSVAVSIILRSADRTLTDQEIEQVQTNGLNRLQSTIGAQLRTT